MPPEPSTTDDALSFWSEIEHSILRGTTREARTIASHLLEVTKEQLSQLSALQLITELGAIIRIVDDLRFPSTTSWGGRSMT